MKRCGGIFDVPHRKEQLVALDKRAAEADFWNDQDAARKTIADANNLKAIIEPFDAVVQQLEDAEVMLELSETEEVETEKAAAMQMVEECLEPLLAAYQKLELQSLLGEDIDACNGKELPPPPPQDLFIEFTKPIYDQLTNKIKDFYRNY